MDWNLRIATLAVVGACCLLGGCMSLGGGTTDGAQVEKRVAELQRSIDSVPLVMSWPVTPLGESISSLSLDRGWAYAQASKRSTVYGLSLDDGLLQFAYGGVADRLDVPPVRNSSASYLISGNVCTAIEHLTGRVLWKQDLRAATTSPAAVSETHLYVGTYTRNLQTYNLADGHADWFWRVADSYISSKPAYHEPTLFFASERGAVVSLDGASGQAGFGEILLQAKDMVLGNLWVHADNVYVSSTDQNLYCVDRLSGKIRWQWTAPAPLSRGALTGGGLCFQRSDDGTMHAIDEASGKQRWEIGDIDRFIVAIAGDAYLLRGSNVLMRIDIKTGEELGRVRLDAWTFVPSNPEGNQLVLGTRDGYVFALQELKLY